jgi:hypothetical protein
MLRQFATALTACAIATTVNVFAQEPAPVQQEKPAAAKETVSGCVVEAKTTDGGTVYVLNNAQGGSGTMYVLAGSAQSEWPTNVRKQVEVTGPVQHPSEPPAEDGTSGKPKALRPPVIEVESVKVIAETCR